MALKSTGLPDAGLDLELATGAITGCNPGAEKTFAPYTPGAVFRTDVNGSGRYTGGAPRWTTPVGPG